MNAERLRWGAIWEVSVQNGKKTERPQPKRPKIKTAKNQNGTLPLHHPHPHQPPPPPSTIPHESTITTTPFFWIGTIGLLAISV